MRYGVWKSAAWRFSAGLPRQELTHLAFLPFAPEPEVAAKCLERRKPQGNREPQHDPQDSQPVRRGHHVDGGSQRNDQASRRAELEEVAQPLDVPAGRPQINGVKRWWS